jgi:signal transduction histidine kinase
MKPHFLVFTLIAACALSSRSHSYEMAVEVQASDTSRILSLNQQADAFCSQSLNDSCLASASRALQLSDQLLHAHKKSRDLTFLNRCKILKTMSLKNIARSIRHTDTRRALDTLQTALHLAQEAGDKNEQASVYSLMGIITEEAYQSAVALDYYRKSLGLYVESGDRKGQADQLLNIGITMRYLRNFGDAMENNLESLKISRQLNDSAAMVEALLAMGFIYSSVEKYDDALKVQQEALQIFKQMQDSAGIARIYNDMGVTNMRAGKLEVALLQHQAALKIRLNSSEYFYTSASYAYIADIYNDLGKFPEAIANYQAALRYKVLDGSPKKITYAYLDLGSAYMKNDEPDKALKMFLTARSLSQADHFPTAEVEAAMNIAKIYLGRNEPGKALAWLNIAEKNVPRPLPVFLKDLYLNIAHTYSKLGDYKIAFFNLQKHIAVKDSVLAVENIEKITTLSNKLEFENKLALQNENHEKLLALSLAQIKRQKITRNFSLFGMLTAFVLVGIVFVRFIEKKKLNNRLNKTLADLKATQSQLVHAEKMASLGELTAGIAHEIQNPLNFVNNFSEVSNELMAEMSEELAAGHQQTAVEIAEVIRQNLEKIKLHGKRADAIVKGMLQHSRTSVGQKEPTDINALADEYLRLAYHGFRAKDKSFNATMKTEFDESIGNVHVIPQDIGRVLLNLITNAFYACTERSRSIHAQTHNAATPSPLQPSFEPTVLVRTRKLDNKIHIVVWDNGSGIPQQVLDKIFQPFFTTKPPGQGTGLGLSMSYDIITKGHGGELKVRSIEGEFAEFTIIIKEG